VAVVCLILGVILLVSAWNSNTRGTRLWLLCWALLNLGVAGHMAVTAYPHAWALLPADTEVRSPAYRR
jgi:hypothetical protein